MVKIPYFILDFIWFVYFILDYAFIIYYLYVPRISPTEDQYIFHAKTFHGFKTCKNVFNLLLITLRFALLAAQNKHNGGYFGLWATVTEFLQTKQSIDSITHDGNNH